MQNIQTKNNQNYIPNNWGFFPTLLSGFAGVAIGVAIGNILGWI